MSKQNATAEDPYRDGARCRQISGSRRYGTITSDVWTPHPNYGGYVDVRWDSGIHELIHISEIRIEK